MTTAPDHDAADPGDAGERAAARALLRYVVAHARSAIAVHDRDLRYVCVSQRYLEEYGVQERDVIGKHHYEVFPDLPQKWRDAHQRALAGEVSTGEEDPYVRADGTVDWTRWECRPWYEADGSVGGIIVYTEVITERRRAEEDRRALEAQLQQAMKMEAIGRLAGGVAHDFNNLLTAISGNVELALLDLDPASRAAASLQEARRASDSAASLTRQLLTFSRKQIVDPRPIDLNALVTNLQKMLGRVIGEDIALRTSLAEGLRPVMIDPAQFEQVVANLAVNARDAMSRGGVLAVATANVEVDERFCERHQGIRLGPFVMLEVADSGEGMPDEVKAHLFEPFFTTKPVGRGTGLGLATIFGAVKQAGGAIDVTSEVGRGTTFRIYLPAVEGPVSSLHRREAPATWEGGSETILLVEDERMVRELAVKVLRRLGYHVLAAASGEEALATAGAFEGAIHLLLTDVVMPGINGRELADRVLALRPETRVLFASGYSENVIVSGGVVEESLNFIAKPYTPTSLARRVRDVLDDGPGSPAG